MNTADTSHPILRFLLRHHVESAACLVTLFVLQTGVVPFDFAEVGTDGSARVFFNTEVSRLTLPDTVSNIFLYVPFGLLVHWSLCRCIPNRTLALLATLTLSTALSGGIEWMQAYSATRVSSMIDLVANVTGAAIGAFVSWTGRSIIPRIAEGTILGLRRRPQAACLKAYCGVLVVFAVMPFSFSFDVTSLKKAARSANFIPFAAADASDPFLYMSRGATTDHKAHAYLEWQKMKRYSRWAAEAASFVVFAWLLQSVLRSDYGFAQCTASLLVCYLGGLFAIGLSALQLPVLSRACDATDVVFRLLGIGVGLVARSMFGRGGARREPGMRPQPLHKLVPIGLTGTATYILYTGLIPFIFDADGERITSSLTSPGFLPFFAYFQGRFDMMMADAAEKFASYMVFSILLAVYWIRIRPLSTGPRHLTVLIVGLGISIFIEITQLFSPVRVPSLTDPIIAGAACAAGVLVQQLAQRFYHSATSRAAGVASETERPPGWSGDLAPGDTLIATLMEPRADAPTETPHARTSRKPQ